uniref:Reverse transcriptase n=1 Tax=Tanacetum cinerariifolium TaxID=118510 RepID=A0A699H4V4_TANCI|nr:reverse transcriptase [Tanacetum cinerariifolium]GEX82942.1 reverse transcriptase [Tanacetum cinerariifolium]
MDAEEIRLLLKEQADAFQSQFPALQVELQATRGMIQAARLGGGGGDLALQLPRSMKLDMPKFFGPDPERWIFSITEYFTLLNTPVDQRLRVRELLVSKPTMLGDAFSLAHVIEARLNDQGIAATTNKSTTTGSPQTIAKTTSRFTVPRPDSSKPALLPTPPTTGVNYGATPLPIEWISSAERQERLSKGLCFNCDSKWVRGHKCPGKFLLVIAEEDDAKEQPTDVEKEDAIESVKRMQLPVTGTKPFKVYIGSGETLLCKNMCAQIMVDIQGLQMHVDLYVLSMKGPDIVLGIQWFQKLGKVTHDYSKQTMEFLWSRQRYTLRREDNLRMKRVSLHHMRALLETEEIYDVYELYNLEHAMEEWASADEADTIIDHAIEQLLTRFETLFQVPTTLPLHRNIDHRIHLYPNTKPINVRTYRYPHYQIGDMESWALNEVNVKDKFLIPTVDEMFDELGGAMVFTKLDLWAGYRQIRVYDRDVYKTAFRTHDGHYEFLDHQFYVKKAKCIFGAKSLEYLAHIFSSRGVEVDLKKSRLQLIGPYLRLNMRYEVFLDSREGFKWGESESKAFKELKDKLTHSPMLGLLDFEDKFVIEADASAVGIGAVSSESQGAYATGGTNGTSTKIRKETYGFDFDIDYKPRTSNIVAYALSQVFKDDWKDIASFMALSRPVVGLLAELKRESEHLDELCQIHRRLDQGEILDGYRREQGLLLFRGRGRPFTKYAHFITLPTSFSASKVAETFMDIVVKHHGLPKTIVCDRDLIFVSKFWKQLFEASGTQLNHSTTYHPQMDGQTEVVNRGPEQYIRAIVSDRPHHWVRLLPWDEYSYNTRFHSSIKMTPFKALYVHVPPSFIPNTPGSSKMQANRHRREVEFSVGDKVLVKLQPYCKITLAKLHSNILAEKYYGPFVILEHVGKVAYRLALPTSIEEHADRPVEYPSAVCDTRIVLRHGIPARQVLAQWSGSSPEEATWEWLFEFVTVYPSYHLEDKVISEEEGNVTSPVEGRPKRVVTRSGWHQYYVMG